MNIKYIGMDVHKEAISIAVLNGVVDKIRFARRSGALSARVAGQVPPPS